jgi:hypothetical protein
MERMEPVRPAQADQNPCAAAAPGCCRGQITRGSALSSPLSPVDPPIPPLQQPQLLSRLAMRLAAGEKQENGGGGVSSRAK